MRRSLPFACALAALVVVHCARRPPPEGVGGGVGGESGQGGAAGQANTKDATTHERQLLDVSFHYDGPSDDGSVDRDAACAVEPVPAEPVALDLYLMLDRSVTMREPLDVVPDCRVGDVSAARWCYAINALAGFFASPTSNGAGVALGFFPHGGCTWTSATEQNCCTHGSCCDGAKDATPEVPLGTLPAALPQLVDALDAQQPLGTTTPIEAALRGLANYTENHRRPGRSMVGILVTDGEPNGCSLAPSDLAAISLNHRATTGIPTFIMGLRGSNFSVLEQLAQAGGATPHTSFCTPEISPCSFYNVDDGRPEAFVAALEQIQRAVVGCRFQLPKTDAGLVDPASLAVDLRPRDGAVRRLTRRASPADCGEGWAPDPAAPGSFVVCPATCSELQNLVGVQLDVLAGCKGS